jgi:hypothetical protein
LYGLVAEQARVSGAQGGLAWRARYFARASVSHH